jgi:CubicO group peptidase (beta-lactamase class C family)
LVSTADDLLAFARMIMNEGRVGDRQLLSKKSVEAMTRDHILAEVKARSPFGSGFWEKRGWGYGGSTVKSPSPGEPRGFGWDGGYGISCYWDRQSGVVGALLTQRLMDSPTYPEVFQKFWDGAYAAAGV